ncbi:hypothetical protein COMA1_30438 [Candidatus Nitrospira nitrosa]|uniref:Uncharacterized protein n=1 Tax=Candidatus Nitrospira nitrosa TaxID=1742972 RepID=A0A0S4LMM5_9BACT|nr:hypothetical protein COMA1_30438 [Candidatus Nitrospira nitrosa]
MTACLPRRKAFQYDRHKSANNYPILREGDNAETREMAHRGDAERTDSDP